MMNKETLENFQSELREALLGIEEDLDEQELEYGEEREDFDKGYVAGLTFAINLCQFQLDKLT